MNSTVLKEIIAFLFGRKYYANIVATKGTTKQEICSYIFATKEAASIGNRNNLIVYFCRNSYLSFSSSTSQCVSKKLNYKS